MITFIKVLCAIVSTISGGFVVSKLWFWFVVPIGVMPIGIAQAIGLDILITFIVTKIGDLQTNSTDDSIKKGIICVVYPWIVFGLAGIVNLFM